MAAVITTEVKPAQRLLTAADLAALPSRLPTGDVNYELRYGVLIIMSPTGGPHGATIRKLFNVFGNQVNTTHFGELTTGDGLILSQDPDDVTAPDIAAYLNHTLPIQTSPEGYSLTIPDLVAEVRSKNDWQPEIDDKVERYLRAGVKLVLIVDPARRAVQIYRPEQPPVLLGASDTIDISDLIPGLHVQVSDLLPQV